MRYVKRGLLAAFVVALPLALASGYRAIVQVYDLTITPVSILAPGDTIRTKVVTSGRAFVDVTLELRQGTTAVILGTARVPGNWDLTLDPRSRHDSLRVVLTPAMLQPFIAGPATLRATALGRSQWLRVPPPTVREMAITIR
jgi:hypothetical protein